MSKKTIRTTKNPRKIAWKSVKSAPMHVEDIEADCSSSLNSLPSTTLRSCVCRTEIIQDIEVKKGESNKSSQAFKSSAYDNA